MTTIWHQLDDNNFKWLQSLLLFGVYYDIPCIKFMSLLIGCIFIT
jgi:hypothetical protein